MDAGSEQRRLNVILALLRVFFGGLAIVSPWFTGSGLDAYGATSVGIGVAVIAAATQIHRAAWLRWVQAALALAVFFGPFLFEADDISDREVYAATMIGFMLLASSFISPRFFIQGDSAPTTASEESRSAASKTSSVSTPSN